jgi:methionyl-tRNA formyltransferase
MRIVFMGTPDFAVSSLAGLTRNHQVLGVVTAPDRAQGRGLKMLGSPVKHIAETLNLPVVQPEILDDPDFIKRLSSWKADCFVVVGFKILPAEVIAIPPRGCINLHASLLPKYRGAAPIQWAIICGEKKTGVTTFYLQEKVDRGDILLQAQTDIGDNETAGELHDRLAEIGAHLLLDTIRGITEGTLIPRPQKGDSSRAPKITPRHAFICWNNPAGSIRNLIRGLSPAPGAFGIIRGKRLKVFEADVLETTGNKPEALPGTVTEAVADQLCVQTGKGLLTIRSCQYEGKDRMSVDVFLMGSGIQKGDRFETDVQKVWPEELCRSV